MNDEMIGETVSQSLIINEFSHVEDQFIIAGENSIILPAADVQPASHFKKVQFHRI